MLSLSRNIGTLKMLRMPMLSRQLPCFGNSSPSSESTSCRCIEIWSTTARPAVQLPVDGASFQGDRDRAVVRAENQLVAVPQQHDRIVGLAKLAGAIDNGLEHRFDIGRR